MSSLVGKWQQPQGQPYPGLWFQFNEDGSFSAEFSEMGIVSRGTYSIDDDNIDMNQTHHTLGFVGQFLGKWLIDGDTLKMSVGQLPGQRPETLEQARLYQKVG